MTSSRDHRAGMGIIPAFELSVNDLFWRWITVNGIVKLMFQYWSYLTPFINRTYEAIQCLISFFGGAQTIQIDKGSRGLSWKWEAPPKNLFIQCIPLSIWHLDNCVDAGVIILAPQMISGRSIFSRPAWEIVDISSYPASCEFLERIRSASALSALHSVKPDVKASP